MSVNLKLYQAEHRPTNDTDPAGGGKGTTEITDATIGENILNFAANPSGGAIKSQYIKNCLFGESGSDTFYSGKIYFLNSIDDLTASRTLKFRINNSTDATNTSIMIIGQNASGEPQTETIAFSGSTSWVSGAKTWKSGAGGLIQFFILNSTSGTLKSLANVACEIADSSDTVLGSIPVGFHSAHANLYIWLEGTLNATTETTNRLTAPGSASWSKPRTSGDGLSVADNIDDGDYQGIWIKETLYPGMANISDGEIKIMWYGSDA